MSENATATNGNTASASKGRRGRPSAQEYEARLRDDTADVTFQVTIAAPVMRAWLAWEEASQARIIAGLQRLGIYAEPKVARESHFASLLAAAGFDPANPDNWKLRD